MNVRAQRIGNRNWYLGVIYEYPDMLTNGKHVVVLGFGWAEIQFRWE